MTQQRAAGSANPQEDCLTSNVAPIAPRASQVPNGTWASRRRVLQKDRHRQGGGRHGRDKQACENSLQPEPAERGPNGERQTNVTERYMPTPEKPGGAARKR